MSISALAPRVHELWEELAAAPVSFGPAGTVRVVASPSSAMCPPGWVGLVVVGGSAIVTAPDDGAAGRVREAFAHVAGDELTDLAVVRALLPVGDALGPAALGYLSAPDFRPVDAAADKLRIEPLPTGHPGLGELDAAAGEAEAGEASLHKITSPAFVLRDGDTVVAACGYQAWPSRTAHISVLTHPAWRGRGLARVTASAAVRHALEAGLLPQWRARVPASRRVARALGFAEIGTQISVELGGPDQGTGRVAAA